MSVGHVHSVHSTGPGNLLRRGSVFGWNLGFAALAVAAGWVFMGQHFALSLALGAIVEAWNFRTLWRSCERIFLSGESGTGPAVAAFGVRFGLMAGFIAIALWAGANAAGLVTGLSMIVPAVVIAAWRARPPVIEGLPSLPQDDPAWDDWNPWLARERDADEEEEE